MKIEKSIAIVIVCVVLLAFFLTFENISGKIFYAANGKTKAVVSEVIDGDTVKLSNGERVRLLCIDAPEKGKRYSEEATLRLKQIVLGKEVTLERDVRNRDRYGRLLRHVFADDDFVNMQMVKGGFAAYRVFPPNTKYADKIIAAEDEARQNGVGIWSSSMPCISILEFNYDAAGNDNFNLNDEYVTFRNSCGDVIDMSDWILKDAEGKSYKFPSFILQSKDKVTIYSGCGKNSDDQLYWCNSEAVWNNDADDLFLLDSTREEIVSYSY